MTAEQISAAIGTKEFNIDEFNKRFAEIEKRNVDKNAAFRLSRQEMKTETK